MAAKKKAASAKDAKEMVMAFALKDASKEESGVSLKLGQRVELPKDEYEGLAKSGLVIEGVFVKMKTSVEGGRYSLKPKDTTWLAPSVFEAWQKLGYCERSSEDPGMGALLKAREEAVRDAFVQRDEATSERDAMEAELKEAILQQQAARAQAVKVQALLETQAEAHEDGADEATTAILGEITTLIDLFPEHIEVADDGSEEPELGLG